MLKNRCYNGGMKHKFEPRYDEQPNPRFCGGEGFMAHEMRSLIMINIYICDICVWCGEIKERKNE